MFETLRHSFFIKYFWGFMALYLLNCSVDSPDAHSYYVDTNIYFNDQESIIEIVLEQILGYEDAIPESEDTDSEQHTGLKKAKHIDHFIVSEITENKSTLIDNTQTAHLLHNHKDFLNPFLEIQAPPPKV